MRDAKDKTDNAHSRKKLNIPQYDIRRLFAEQELATGGRRHVQVDNRPELFFTHYASGR